MKFQNGLEKGVYSMLKQLLDTQRQHGTDDYNEYVFNIIQPLVEMNVLSYKWRNVFESYKEWSGQNFDYGELGDLLLKEFK